ncbi:E3 ubiquitin-protein ligase RNF181-like [Phoenix dactylifera]|uniref:E3 ubiquitin-protein ligase RNF181-like n=1 Tax=Phoenix dactylifera TaxID=42345 RepID=A0A8B7C5X5_PHODC|nr:E3 ubiquitin-protein ligase RNF181-like [Phoenix dactylifera]
MSSKSFAFTTPGNSRAWDEYESCSPDYDSYWSRQRPGDQDRSTHAPWRLFEERVRSGPYGFTRFPSQPYSPARVLAGDVEDRVNPRLRQFVRDAPPQIRREWHLGPEERGLSTKESSKKAPKKKLGKHVYHPTRRAREGDRKDEGERCTICLDAFVPNEHVMMTPCNHMFHPECLVPWVKGHGNCPVCRHALSEREETTGSSSRSSSSSNNHHGNNLAGELSLLIRAMEEAFNWVGRSRDDDSCH